MENGDGGGPAKTGLLEGPLGPSWSPDDGGGASAREHDPRGSFASRARGVVRGKGPAHLRVSSQVHGILN